MSLPTRSARKSKFKFIFTNWRVYLTNPPRAASKTRGRSPNNPRVQIHYNLKTRVQSKIRLSLSLSDHPSRKSSPGPKCLKEPCIKRNLSKKKTCKSDDRKEKGYFQKKRRTIIICTKRIPTTERKSASRRASVPPPSPREENEKKQQLYRHRQSHAPRALQTTGWYQTILPLRQPETRRQCLGENLVLTTMSSWL